MTDKPTTSSAAEFALQALVAAGHVSQELVDKAMVLPGAPQPAHSGEPVAFIHWPVSGPPRLVWHSQKALNDAILKGYKGYQPDEKLYTAPQPSPTPQADSAQDDFISREEWVERAMRVYLIAGDTEDVARECAEYQWGELDMDDIPDPYFTAMEDIEGRGPAPQADSQPAPAGTNAPRSPILTTTHPVSPAMALILEVRNEPAHTNGTDRKVRPAC